MDDFANEKQLIAEIDRLRVDFPHTQDLYREVCVLLFFRHGMTPTANKLYQLVRKGSMTAPAEALNKFWEDLREKSRVRIEHPDLPDALKIAAGELTATLWSTAQAQARESVSAAKAEIQASMLEAATELERAINDSVAAKAALAETQEKLSNANIRINQLDQDLAAAGATRSAMESQLAQSKEENLSFQQRLEDARRDFSSELDKLRTAANLAEERSKATDTRALLEIDRERNIAAKLQRELEAARVAAIHKAECDRAEIVGLQKQIGDFRQQTGLLEGKLQAVTAAREATLSEYKTAQTQLSLTIGQTASLLKEIEDLRRQAKNTSNGKVTKPVRSSRKPKQSQE